MNLSPLLRFLFLVVGASSQFTFAQVGERNNEQTLYKNAKAYISIDVPISGVASEDKEIFINPTTGSYVYVIIDNYPTNFTVDQIVLKSYKKANDKYEKLKEETFNINKELYYTYIKYSFVSEGDYAFDVYDKNGIFIKSAFVKVSNKLNATTENNKISPYKGVKVYCSVSVPERGMATESKTISIDRETGSYAYIVIDNYPNNFKVKSVELKSYKKVDEKWASIKNEKFDISTDYYFTFLKYIFYTSGDYVFDVYDENNEFIGTAYLTVNYK